MREASLFAGPVFQSVRQSGMSALFRERWSVPHRDAEPFFRYTVRRRFEWLADDTLASGTYRSIAFGA